MSLESHRGSRREHVLFGAALICLLMLASWWITFMARSVQLEYDYALVEIRQEAMQLAYTLESPELDHESLRVVPEAEGSDWAIPLVNLSDWAIDIRTARLDELASTLSRRRVMVLGEGGFLLGLLGVCILMLFRLVASRRSVQREMELFVGQMTHEMKTPLAGLRALLETLQKGRLKGEGLNEALALGLRQIEREEHLVQVLLHAQRLRVMPESIAADRVDLEALLQGFVENRKIARPGEPERYRFEAERAIHCMADRDAVWTILENLFDNADKYGATLVTLQLGVQSGKVRISCTDNGQGFDLSRPDTLFAPFSSQKEAGQEHKHGTGLGLYISRRLARAMGGDLTGESAGVGEGASFVLELPEAPV